MARQGIQRTLVLIRPHVLARHRENEVLACYEQAGLRIVETKRLQAAEETIKLLYAEHAAKHFYAYLVRSMCEGELMAVCIEGVDAIAVVRRLHGPTILLNCGRKTMRRRFGLDNRRNGVHSSDSEATATCELALFFHE